jgi:hypothetical protein
VAEPTAPLDWMPFECGGQTFEYATIPTTVQERPARWPAHKPSPSARESGVLVIVRKPGDKTGPGMVYPDGTVITTEHAIETARRFWTNLMR